MRACEQTSHSCRTGDRADGPRNARNSEELAGDRLSKERADVDRARTQLTSSQSALTARMHAIGLAATLFRQRARFNKDKAGVEKGDELLTRLDRDLMECRKQSRARQKQEPVPPELVIEEEEVTTDGGGEVTGGGDNCAEVSARRFRIVGERRFSASCDAAWCDQRSARCWACLAA